MDSGGLLILYRPFHRFFYIVFKSFQQCRAVPSSKTTILRNYWKVHNSALQVLTFASDGICQPASFYSPHTSVLNNRPAVQFLAYSHLFSWYLHLSQNISFEQQHNNEQPCQQIRKQILVGGQQIQNGKLFASKANNQLKVSKLLSYPSYPLF